MIDPRQPDFANGPADARRAAFEYKPHDPQAAPLVTIVTPFFNTPAEIFDQTARSILGQSFQQWEWLIVNDASTHSGALAALDRYRTLDARVRVIDQPENRGVSAARNAGFAAARAELVMSTDDDDLLEPTTVEKLFWHLHSHPEFAVANSWSVNFGSREYLWPAGFERGAQILESNSATSRALIRKAAHRAAGGYDERLRSGMEDWDFWLRLAGAGFWGSTVPEYLDWYRRRADHVDRWADMDSGRRFREFVAGLRERHARLYAGAFPETRPSAPQPNAAIAPEPPATNRLTKSKRRVLLILPWVTYGGADKVNLDILDQLIPRGWEATIATTNAGDHAWLSEFAARTPDIFVMQNFLKPADFPLFLRYLIDSRNPDVVLLSNSELAYLLLPYLRAHCPAPAYADLCHSEAPRWNDGGFPRYSVSNHDLLDLQIVLSQHLKGYMVARSADPSKIGIAYANVDTQRWTRSEEQRRRTRAELKLREDDAAIVFVGRLHEDKQPQILARVFGEMTRRGCAYSGLIVGDGPERAAFEKELAQCGAARQVRVLGALPSAETRAIIQAADVLVLTSLWEGIALTLYEAMSLELPVVAADVGGQRELVTAECGYLLPKGPTDEVEARRYADALETLIRDPAKRRSMGVAGRRRVVEQFDIARLGQRIDELFGIAVESAKRPQRAVVARSAAEQTAMQAVEWLRRTNEPMWLRAQSAAGGADGAANERTARLLIESELAHIENSRAWRAIMRIKRFGPVRMYSRWRHGPHAELAHTSLDPAQRLAWIRGSTFYRLLLWVKRTAPYRWYAIRRYGADFDKSPAYRA